MVARTCLNTYTVCLAATAWRTRKKKKGVEDTELSKDGAYGMPYQQHRNNLRGITVDLRFINTFTRLHTDAITKQGVITGRCYALIDSFWHYVPVLAQLNQKHHPQAILPYMYHNNSTTTLR